jgi:putative CocE/NonD family hydrolase
MKKILFALVLLTLNAPSFSQKIFFSKSNYADSTSLDQHIATLAYQLTTVYKESDERTYFDNLFRLQLLCKQYQSVNKSLKKIDLLVLGDSITPTALEFPFQIYNKTLATIKSNDQFASVFENIFLEKFTPLTEDGKNWVAEYYPEMGTAFYDNLQKKIKTLSSNDSISIPDAVKLCKSYSNYKTFYATYFIAKSILNKIENEKYIIEDSVLIKMPDGGTIATTIVRDRKMTTAQPVVLIYNIYPGFDINSCKNAVARGYIGVVADTRGKRLSKDEIEPYEHDAKDAYEIIDWISKQNWCNGKVGMYGGSYLGFSQWSATKYLHPALKTIVPQASVALGINFPFHNGVFSNYRLRWLHYVVNNKLTDDKEFNDEQKWNSLFENYYSKGSSLRSLDSLEGRPNKIFQKWLQHPNYDIYWQKMLPFKEEFSKINIPVLTTTGYWDDDQTGAMYFYHELQKWNKNSNQYLLIGPFDHSGSQFYPKQKLGGYTIDSVANIPIIDILFQWFDYTLKDSIRPAILKDKVNFEIMGLNKWKSVASIDKMANDTLKLYPILYNVSKKFSLSFTKPNKIDFISQTIDFKDRSELIFSNLESSMGAYPQLVDTIIRCEKEKLIFISDPIKEPFAISGALNASIVASINKKDMDLVIDLFEQTPDGKYFALTQNIQRASYSKDRTKRQLLMPNKIETIQLTNTFITCRQLKKGSRIVIVMGVNKNPNWQVNYGTGNDVSDETMKDAYEPLQIKWYNSSCIKLPILR